MKLTLPNLVCAALLAASPVHAQDAPATLDECVTALRDGDAAARDRAVAAAPRWGAQAVPAIGALLVTGPGQDAEAGFRFAAARRALWRIASGATTPAEDARQVADARRETTKALLDLLADAAVTAAARAEVLHMVALTANDRASILRIAPLLDAEGEAPAALFALQRIAHPAAEQVLIERLGNPGALPAAAVVAALGARRSSAATESLMALLHGTDPALAREVRGALARIGDPKAAETLRAAAEKRLPGAEDDWVAFLDAWPVADDSRAALATHYLTLLSAPQAEVRVVGLRGLERVGGDDPRPIVASLGDADPAVQHAARSALTKWSHAGGDEFLLATRQSAPPRVRANVLRILAARSNPRALELTRADARHDDPVVRRAALELLGNFTDPSLEEVLFDACGDEDAQTRAIAAGSLSRYSDQRLRSGDRDGALRLLHRIVDAGADPALLREAIAHLGRIGDPASLPHLDAHAEDTLYREAVADARMAIAIELPEDQQAQAVELLQAAFRASGDRDRRRSALEHLGARGVDTGALVRKSGFLQDWLILGPWDKAKDKDDLMSLPLAAAGLLADAVVPNGDRELKWQPYRSNDPDGLADLTFLRPRDNVSAFAQCTVDWPVAAEMVLKIGSDDGVAVWVNGELVHANLVPRGVTIDEDRATVTFVKGANTILLRVDQGGGDWGFCVRLCDRDGTPIDLSQQ